jgi:sugar/nucleoside kinase (ribokinase family)
MLDIKTILKISKPILESTTILFPSGEEAEMLAGIKNIEQACKKLLEMGPKIVVLKQGKNGCTIYSSEKTLGLKIEGFKVKEVDPTGAGDSFDGAFIVGYLAGWEFEDIGKFANAVGALKVKHFGPITDNTYEEVLKLMEST